MGGAAELPQRSSSPLKRTAADFDDDVTTQKDDLVMESVTRPDATESKYDSRRDDQSDESVDMVKARSDVGSSSTPKPEQNSSDPRKPSDVPPPIDHQVATVGAMTRAHYENQREEGEKAYLVSKQWLMRVHARTTEALEHSKTQPEGDIGPIDNSDIIKQIIKDSDGNDFVQLKPGLGMESFEMFPEHVWDIVERWYGVMGGSIPIVRFAHNTNTEALYGSNIQFEFHPPVFVLHRLWSDNTNFISQILKAGNPSAPVLVASRSDNYNEFLKRMKKHAKIENRKVRVWRIPRSLPASKPSAPTMSTNTPPSSRPSSPQQLEIDGQQECAIQDTWKNLLLDIESFSKLEKDSQREKIDFDQTGNENYNGHLNLQFYGLGDDMSLVLDEHVSGDDYVSNHVPRRGAANMRSAGSSIGKTSSQVSSGRNSPAPGPMTRGRAQRASGRTPGQVGLSNLGNTCYMNSALQCVRSVEELTKYFLSRVAESEINYENLLGHNGEVARAYSNLLFEIFKQPPPTSVAPRNFKNIIGKYAPQFSGYGQQDSQEFLGFLLDGLQEDLSRIKKKPYIEKPDSTDDMINDREAIRAMAAKVWDITKQRDDSVVADLFTGMYKSTLVCPVCSKVSITFDPFNNLTLQLPVENIWSHKIYYFPLNDVPIMIDVELDKSASIMAMKGFISIRVGVPADRLFVAEEFKSKFYRIYTDSEQASEVISGNDNVAVYELEAKPTNWPWFKKEKEQKKGSSLTGFGTSREPETGPFPHWNDPMSAKMVVSVISRRQNPESRTTRKSRVFVPVPFFIVISPEEAKSEDTIRRKVLEKVTTFTTSDLFVEDEDETPASVTDSIDPDLVLTTGSDADSSGDGKVVATSVDGEDELVDVTMKDAHATSKVAKPPTQAAKPLKAFKSRRPKFMQSGSFLNPELQNLFDMSYHTNDKDIIPHGLGYQEEDKIWPLLSSRLPPDQMNADGNSSNEYDMPNGRSASESSNEDVDSRQNSLPRTRIIDEASSSDEDPPRISKNLPLRSRQAQAKGRGSKSFKTYGRHNSRISSSLRLDGAFDEPPEQGPLVRLGEGLILDWSENAWDALFESTGPDDNFRASTTYQHIPHLEDSDLTAKRKARNARRNHGITLDDCLNEFGKEEVLSEQDTWYCPRCKEHQRASKKFELWKTPDILIMHLKRFSSVQHRRDKIDVDVKFPVAGLDLTTRVLERVEGQAEVYDLFAVDDHWGGLGGGHYTAYAKNFVDREWYEYNDSSVTKQTDAERVVTSSAYLLFYRRRSDTYLGGPKIRQVIEAFDSGEQNDDESGEGQSLGVDSSLRGSPRALTGVGATLHQRDGSDGVEMTTVDPNDIEGLPAYRDHQHDEDSAPLLASDANMNDGLHESIEDEGIDVGSESAYDPPSAHFNTWTFDSLNQHQRSDYPSGTGSDEDYVDDDRSDVAAHDSSASEASLQGRMEDIQNAMADGDEGFVEPSPVPDIDDDEQMMTGDLHDAVRRQGLGAMAINQFEVTPLDAGEETEEPAMEIHVEEGEGLKMSDE